MNRLEEYKFELQWKGLNDKSRDWADKMPTNISIDGSFNNPPYCVSEAFSSTDKYGTKQNGTPVLSDVDKIYFARIGHILLIEEKNRAEGFEGYSIQFKKDRILKNGRTSLLLVATDYTTGRIDKLQLMLFNGLTLDIVETDLKALIKILMDLLDNEEFIKSASARDFGGLKRMCHIIDSELIVKTKTTDTASIDLRAYSRDIVRTEIGAYECTTEEIEALYGLINALKSVMEGDN